MLILTIRTPSTVTCLNSSARFYQGGRFLLICESPFLRFIFYGYFLPVQGLTFIL